MSLLVQRSDVSEFRRRFRWIALGTVLVFMSLVARLFYLQVIEADERIEIRPTAEHPSAAAAGKEHPVRRSAAPWLTRPGLTSARCTRTTRTTRTHSWRRSKASATFVGESFVHVVRDDVEPALLVLIDAVVAGARPVTVAVDERNIQRQKP